MPIEPPQTSIPSPEATAILQLLVNLMQEARFLPGDEQSYVGYKEAHTFLRLPQKGFHWGSSLRQQGLEDLALFLRGNHLPAITGLIVDQSSFLPGDGYYTVNDRPLNDRDWWKDQVRHSIAYDWSAYVQEAAVPTLDETNEFERAIIEGALCTVIIYLTQ